jgi:carbamate kinase
VRVVVALGGNALLQRGQALNAENQRGNIRVAAVELAAVHAHHQLVIAHGNGPQVGLLALMDAAYAAVDPFPLDVLGAETVGMIGYMIEQELGNIIPTDDHIVTVLTQVLVDPQDPAFQHPSKPVGPVYERAEAEQLQREKGWSIAPDGKYYRRVVPSPLPQRIIEIEAIRMLVDHGIVVICAGGGGIPTAYDAERKLYGVEAVIDKDLASGLLARDLGADMLVMLTDVPSLYANFGTARQRRKSRAGRTRQLELAAGSMGPKVDAACQFTRATGKRAAIGQLCDLRRILNGEAGTLIAMGTASTTSAEFPVRRDDRG